MGIDEHTSLIIDFAEGVCHVRGNDSVTILRQEASTVIRTGEEFDLNLLGEWFIPEDHPGVSQSVWETVSEAQSQEIADRDASTQPPPQAFEFLHLRQQARLEKNWQAADKYRAHILDLGWQVNDTPEGPELIPADDE